MVDDCSAKVEVHVLRREVLRWTALVALLYGAVVLFECPCNVLLECSNHNALFQGSLALAIVLVTIQQLFP